MKCLTIPTEQRSSFSKAYCLCFSCERNCTTDCDSTKVNCTTNCDSMCTTGCDNTTCSKTEMCVAGCVEGLYGQNCSLPCPDHCSNSSCFRDNGTCQHGCEGDYFGDTCELCKYT